MKASTKKRLKMVEEIMELMDKHKQPFKVEVAAYGVKSHILIPETKKLFGRRLKHFYAGGDNTSWIRLHNGKSKEDYLSGNLVFTIRYPKGKGGDN